MQTAVPGLTTTKRQVILIPDETGGYTVEVPSLPGCFSEGDTVDEALANIQEAITLWIEDALEHNEEVPGDVPAPVQVAMVTV
ncbi:MAG: type II toxin-antitoxin system HicB family antitoxin [Aggregatilineales bacterium]